VANAVFTEDFPSNATLTIARRAGASYVLVPLAAEIVDPVRLDGYLADHPGLVAYRNSTTYVLRICSASCGR
jgi:hypothetical protein